MKYQTVRSAAIPSYHITRMGCNRHGGGLAFYEKNCVHLHVLLKGPSDLEFLLFSVKNFNFSYKIHVGLFYRPPSSPFDVLEKLQSCLLDALLDATFNWAQAIDGGKEVCAPLIF